MKHALPSILLLLFFGLISSPQLAAQNVLVQGNGSCFTSAGNVFTLTGTDGMGRNTYFLNAGDGGLNLSYRNNRWEISDVNQGRTIYFANCDAAPQAPSSTAVTWQDANEPFYPCTGAITVSGPGTQDNCNAGDPCAMAGGDSDGDGVCDNSDVCPGFDDNIDPDGDGIPSGCDDNPNTFDGVIVDDGNCLTASGDLLFQKSGTDATGRFTYANVNSPSTIPVTIVYDAGDARWELRNTNNTRTFYANDLPSFPEAPSSTAQAWYLATGEGSNCGTVPTVSGSETQDDLGCDLALVGISASPAGCQAPGSVVISTSGGSGDLTFSLTNEATTTTATGTTGNFSNVPAGTYTVSVQDNRFPAGTCNPSQSGVVVADPQPAFASCPTDISVNVAAGVCSAPVSYTLSSANNCPSESISQTDGSGLASGSDFPLGVTLQRYELSAPNATTAICEFSVTVSSAGPPANDECNNAEDIQVSPTRSLSLEERLTTCAATFGGAQAKSCTSVPALTTEDVWASFTATRVSHEVRVTDLASADPAVTNPALFVTAFSGTCGALLALDCATFDEDSDVLTLIGLAPGVTYYLQLQPTTANQLLAFDLAVVTDPAILPIELTAFTGTALPKTNLLEWTTALEENTATHQLERSADGTANWTVVTRIAAAGNSTAERHYAVFDNDPLATAYYRLRSIDFDGSEQLSELLRIERAGGPQASIRTYPNPVTDELNLSIGRAEAATLTFRLTDLAGRQLRTLTVSAAAGRTLVPVNLADLPAGIYFLTTPDGPAGPWTTRLVKQ